MVITDRPKAIVFDTFGTVVDWRGSLIVELAAFGDDHGISTDWPAFVDAWRAEYAPSMDRVRRGDLPWMTLDELHRASLERLLAEREITGLTEVELDHLNRGWHRLVPWPDSVAGLVRLKRQFIIGPLSNGNVALLVDMAKHAGLPWDFIPGSDVFGHYKPDAENYLGVCRLLRLEPSGVMLAAAHPRDLAAARALGLQTAFFPRPTEHGVNAPVPEGGPDGPWDVIAYDIEDLASQLGL
jgi:2-haloacid dehalogenase